MQHEFGNKIFILAFLWILNGDEIIDLLYEYLIIKDNKALDESNLSETDC